MDINQTQTPKEGTMTTETGSEIKAQADAGLAYFEAWETLDEGIERFADLTENMDGWTWIELHFEGNLVMKQTR